MTSTRIIMFDARSGMLLHQTALHALVAAWGLATHAGRLFVALSPSPDGLVGGSSTILVLDARTGTTFSSVRVNGAVSRLLVDETAGHVFAAYGPQSTRITTVSMLAVATGRLLHTVALPEMADPRDIDRYAGGRWLQSVAVDERASRAFLCLAARTESVLEVLDTRTGNLIRTLPTGEQNLQVAVDEATNRAFLAGMAQDFTHYYFGDSVLTLLDARTASVRRTIDLQRATNPRVVVDPLTRHVFIVSEGTYNRFEHVVHTGSLRMLDAATGALQAHAQLHIAIVSQLVASAHHLAISDAVVDRAGHQVGSTLWSVFDTRTGALVRMSPDSRVGWVIGEEGGGRLLVMTWPSQDRTGNYHGQALVQEVNAAAWP